MMFIGILTGVALIAALCYLLFALAVFALPVFAGAAAGILAHQTGAGWTGGLLVGLVVAALALAAGQLLVASLRPAWLKLPVILVYVAPAGIAGFHATHGIAVHLLPAETWQLAFSVAGAFAVAMTAFIRVTAVAAPGLARQG